MSTHRRGIPLPLKVGAPFCSRPTSIRNPPQRRHSSMGQAISGVRRVQNPLTGQTPMSQSKFFTERERELLSKDRGVDTNACCRACARARVCVCVCVRERERESQNFITQMEGGREGERERLRTLLPGGGGGEHGKAI